MTISPDLDRRFRDAASMLGLVDMGFDVVDSPAQLCERLDDTVLAGRAG